MRSWFHPASAVLRTWYGRTYGDISFADYFDFEQLNLEEYSYSGGPIHKLISADPG
jgi:hypothetical protein